MTAEEWECVKALADKAHIGEYVTFVCNGERIGGTVRWVHNHGLNIELGMPREWRIKLGWADASPQGQATFEW